MVGAFLTSLIGFESQCCLVQEYYIWFGQCFFNLLSIRSLWSFGIMFSVQDEKLEIPKMHTVQ